MQPPLIWFSWIIQWLNLIHMFLQFGLISLSLVDLMLWFIGIDVEIYFLLQIPGIWMKPSSDDFNKCITRPKNRISKFLVPLLNLSSLFLGLINCYLDFCKYWFPCRNRIENKWLSPCSCQWWIESNENRGRFLSLIMHIVILNCLHPDFWVWHQVFWSWQCPNWCYRYVIW